MKVPKNCVCNGGGEKQTALDACYYYHQFIFSADAWTSKTFQLHL